MHQGFDCFFLDESEMNLMMNGTGEGIGKIQVDPAYSNSNHLSLFRTQNHFPWIWPSVIYNQLFQTPAISNDFSFSLRVRNSRLQQ